MNNLGAKILLTTLPVRVDDYIKLFFFNGNFDESTKVEHLCYHSYLSPIFNRVSTWPTQS